MSIRFEDRKVCIMDESEYSVVYEFDIAYPGWECDSKCYIINFFGEPRLVMSDHGRFSIVSREGIDPVGEGNERTDVLQLQLQLDMYRDLADAAQKAIDILKRGRCEEN